MTIRCTNLDIRIKKTSKTILSGVNLEAKEDAITLVVGNSGSGKSLLCMALSGFSNYGKGNIEVLDKKRCVQVDLGETIFILPTPSILFDGLTVKENIDFYICEHEIITKHLLNTFGFGEKFLSKSPLKLSQGERKIISFLIAIYSNKPIVFLDEPFADIDIENIQKCIEILKKLRKTLIIFDHENDKYNEIYSKLYEIHDKKVEFAEERNVSFKVDKLEEKNDVKSNKKLFYYFKILLFKKRFIFSDILLAVFSAFSAIFLNLLLNVSFLNVDFSLINDKNSLLYSYLAFFLIILFIFVTSKIIFLIFRDKAYLKDTSLLAIRDKKRSELFLFISLSQLVSFAAYLILYFSLFYYFSFEFPFLLNGNFYSLVDYEHYLPLSCFLSFLVLSAVFVIFIVISFLFNLFKRKKNLQLEEN